MLERRKRMTFSEAYIPEFDNEMANTRKLLDCVPDDKFGWKPHAKSMSLGRLATHIAELVEWGTLVVNQDKLELGTGSQPKDPTTKAGLTELLDKNVAASRQAIAGATDDHLAGTWTLLYGGHTIFAMPRMQVLRGVVLSHVIHHRGQLSVYLRLLDVPIPGMYGPSADA
jgi:uncharacterized damage-inducible protein DinB